MTLPPQAILLAGPTAAGKSEVALELASRSGGEIISVDSMQVYRGLNIGTAKPTFAEQSAVRHHLLDILELDEQFDAARFLRFTELALGELARRNSLPIFCGGTGLYFKALLEGLGQGPPRDDALRARLEAKPLPVLLEDLARRDPDSFARVDRQNPRRVVRALEIVILTGQSATRLKADWKQDSDLSWPRFFGLNRSREDLTARIDLRVDRMFEAGLVQETRQLLDRGLDRNPTALQAIGYRQVAEHLQGARSLDETILLVKQRTRQFARRQMTWFRRKLKMQWLDLEPHEPAGRTVDRLLAFIRDN